MACDFGGRVFRAIANSSTGEVGGGTGFRSRQNGDVPWANCADGDIRRGHLVAMVVGQGCLDMRCHHVNKTNDLMTGVFRSRPEVLDDGRYHLHETWCRASGDRSGDASVLEEVTNPT